MTSSKYCVRTRNRIKLPNAKNLETEQDHDEFLSKLTSALCCENFNRLPLNSSLGRLPLSELAQELKTGKLISKFEDFDCYSDGEDESPYVYTCSFVLAIMYFERLKASNPNYLKCINSSELFLMSLLVASKYLHDDGELDSAINSEWAAAYGISLKTINQMEKDYLSAMNWEFFISDEEFTTKHKQIVDQLYGDLKKSNSVLLKMFLLISSVVQTIRKLYRRKIVRQKIKQMIAMSTVITVVTATSMRLKINNENQNLIPELYDEIESNPNYPIISFTHNNETVHPEHATDDSKTWHSYNSKLVQLLDHLLLMNICVSENRQLLHQTTTTSDTDMNHIQNTTNLKYFTFFNYLKSENHKS
ncbi:Cyclin-like,Cyclin PHO80-like [Cinara cedri]|uniref:Protein CNPPD1 n=1 Tax=Cinara cedri TaxID=506608 RepID=A0A5E4N628_9HEMI|nr:Cyclin-like,Cyclin PHO80-like [Cinara cedri]